MGIRDLLHVTLIIGSTTALVASLYPSTAAPNSQVVAKVRKPDPTFDATLSRLNESFRKTWRSQGARLAPRASELDLIRRVSLALTGSIPSLEEQRRLDEVPEGKRVEARLESLLGDRRHADYLAERFARAFVGTEEGPFLIYRRRRFVSWLSDRFMENIRYDALVRELIASEGIWTDKPATNFLTVTYDPEAKLVDRSRLAGRVTRAFLASRIDCAECHDHPFQPWKQKDFQGLAAFFAQAQNGLTGMHEEPGEYEPVDRKTGKTHVVSPSVPFLPELLPKEGNRRQRLARWVTDPKNGRFSEAAVNRVWALLFGKALVDPVDDLSSIDERPEALSILAEDFKDSGFDLRRLIRLLVSSEVFQRDSAYHDGGEPSETDEQTWAIFPMTRLRPEQVVGALFQAASLSTIDASSPLVVRFFTTVGKNEFIQRYGDSGEDEFDGKAGTIPQRLLMMNGKIVMDKTKSNVFNAAARIGMFAESDEAAVDLAYRTTLCRHPSAEENSYFVAKLRGKSSESRREVMTDLFWTLVNSSEFSWNH